MGGWAVVNTLYPYASASLEVRVCMELGAFLESGTGISATAVGLLAAPFFHV